MKFIFALLIFGAYGCVSFSESSKIPKLDESMSIKDLLEAGVVYGEPLYKEASQLVVKKQAVEQAHAITSEMILSGKYEGQQLWRLINYFQATSGKFISPKVFDRLVRSKDAFTRQLGWMLAANRPSDLIAVTIDRYLTRAVLDGEEKKVLVPEMALAVKANRLVGSYSLLKRGLMETGGAEFVDAMIQLNPVKSMYDFMDYLALATVEDLRQMNQKVVDMQTCVAILKIYLEKGIPIEHPKFEHMFLYAVSRNAALKDLASSALEKYMSQNRDQLAYTLARLPVWIQLAFIEGTRDRMNAVLGLFLSELRGVTAHKEVVDEINGLRL